MEEPVAFAADDGVTLAGALTRPELGGPAPAALVLSGSGPLDRDSNMPGQTLDVANAIAAALAERGVASLRYDKRGVGGSGGDYLTTGFERETADAGAALDALRRAAGVDGERVAVVGHSVGAVIAIRLASEDDRLAGAVLLAAAARPGEKVMRDQAERVARTMRGPARLATPWVVRRQAAARQALRTSTGDVVRIARADLPARWFREYMSYDPVPALRAIRYPVLAITGRNDIQVDPEDVARIGRLVQAPVTGETPERLTHLLRTHPRPGLGGYRAQLRRPVDAALLERIATWVAARTAA
jgi:pimeloyl-ACP methyl ester carboxylesterase